LKIKSLFTNDKERKNLPI